MIWTCAGLYVPSTCRSSNQKMIQTGTAQNWLSGSSKVFVLALALVSIVAHLKQLHWQNETNTAECISLAVRSLPSLTEMRVLSSNLNRRVFFQACPSCRVKAQTGHSCEKLPNILSCIGTKKKGTQSLPSTLPLRPISPVKSGLTWFDHNKHHKVTSTFDGRKSQKICHGQDLCLQLAWWAGHVAVPPAHWWTPFDWQQEPIADTVWLTTRANCWHRLIDNYSRLLTSFNWQLESIADTV